jgi:anti-sigma B factor antagonist
MEAHEYKLGNVVVLELKGRVDEFNTHVLADELATIINTGRFRIAIDLNRTGFLSAHCLNVIWSSIRRARSLGGDVVLVGAEGDVLETIHFVEFDRVAMRFYSLDEAMGYFSTVETGPIVQREWAEELRMKAQLLRDGTFGLVRRSFKALRTLLPVLLLAEVLFGTTPDARADTNPAPTSADVPSRERSSQYTLDEVLALVREASPAIRLARLRLMEKESEVRMAKSWGLPKLIGTAGYLYQSNPSIMSDLVNKELNNARQQSDDVNADQLQSRTKLSINKDAAIVGFGFSQLVYSGGVYRNQVGFREAQRREADVLVTIESKNVEEQARNLFLGLLLTKEKLRFLKAHKAAVEQRKVAATRAYEMKTMSAVQFSEIELLGLKVTQELLTAEKDEQGMRGMLNIMLGRPIEALLEPVGNEMSTAMELQSPEHYFEIALHRYPELQRATAQMDSAASYVEMVRAQSTLSPQAMVFGSTEYTYGLGIEKKDLSWSLGFGVYVPLYDGRKSNAEMDKAVSLASQARLSYEAGESRLQVEINEVVAEIRRAQLQHELAEKTLDIAVKKRSEAQEAVKQGQLPLYRLSEVLSQEMEAKIAVIAAQAEFFRWRAKLLLLTGQRES